MCHLEMSKEKTMADELTNRPKNEIALMDGIIDIEKLVAEWLGLDVANGDACSDTIKTYQAQFDAWATWCRVNNVEPQHADIDDLKRWRQDLVVAGEATSTIKRKLTIVRRFYQAAVDRGLIKTNPVANVKAPKERRATSEKVKYLSAGEAELLFRAVPVERRLKNLRDRAMIALMALEGLRRVEIERANTDDLERTPDEGVRLLVHGKGRDGYVYPREDTTRSLMDYIEMRGSVDPDSDGQPLFVRIAKGSDIRGRITRGGINSVVDTYLRSAGLKKAGISCHALRHTCGTLIYQATRDVKAVMETLRHRNINTSAIYAGIANRSQARYSREIQVKINGGNDEL